MKLAVTTAEPNFGTISDDHGAAKGCELRESPEDPLDARYRDGRRARYPRRCIRVGRGAADRRPGHTHPQTKECLEMGQKIYLRNGNKILNCYLRHFFLSRKFLVFLVNIIRSFEICSFFLDLFLCLKIISGQILRRIMHRCDNIEFIWNYSANLNIVREGAFLSIFLKSSMSPKIQKSISAFAVEKA
jgi:hypothetical protein